MFDTSLRRSRSRTTPRRRAGFRPRVESLEARDVPTATYTYLASSENPSIYGQSVTFTATVTGGSFPPGGAPSVSDTVSFSVDGYSLPLATVPVVFGRAQYSVAGLAPGLHFINAVYSGGSEFILPSDSTLTNDPSASSPVLLQQEVDPAPPPPPASLFAINVSSMVQVRTGHRRNHGTKEKVTLENRSGIAIDGPLSLVLDGLNPGVSLRHAAGLALLNGTPGSPYATSDAPELGPGQSLTLTLFFSNPKRHAIHFNPVVVAGAGIV